MTKTTNENNYVVTWTYTPEGYNVCTDETTDLMEACEQARELSKEDETMQFVVMEIIPLNKLSPTSRPKLKPGDDFPPAGFSYKPLYIFDRGIAFISEHFTNTIIAQYIWDSQLEDGEEREDAIKFFAEKTGETYTDEYISKIIDLPFDQLPNEIRQLLIRLDRY